MSDLYTSMLTDFEDVMSVSDVCRALHLGRNSVYKLLNSGEIKSIRLARKHLIPRIAVIDYLVSV